MCAWVSWPTGKCPSRAERRTGSNISVPSSTVEWAESEQMNLLRINCQEKRDQCPHAIIWSKINMWLHPNLSPFSLQVFCVL